MNNKIIRYRPSPTLKRFHESKAFVKAIRGPIGSGKTAACCMELFKIACEQTISYDGVRRTKFAIVRNTYGQLKTTTIPTWNDWFGDITKIVFSAPIVGKMNFVLQDGTRVDCELVFFSHDHPKDVRNLLGGEFTAAWINEAKELPFTALDVSTRFRYPNKNIYGKSKYKCLIMDTNSCDIDCWYYEYSENKKPKNWDFFVQPPALIRYQTGKEFIYEPNPDAENIDNLDDGYVYYLREIEGKTKDWVEIYILNHYGSPVPGNKVYADYSIENHTDIVFNPHLPIHWTHDFNFSPLSSAILQVSKDKTNVYAIDEIIIYHADPQQAAIEFVERYQDHKGLPIYIYGDASGRVGEKHGQMSSWIKVKEYLTRAGFNVIMRVPKGNPAIRDGQNAVRAKVFDATGKRTFFVNPAKCRTVDEGMMTLKTKEGSTFLEDEKANSQHVLSALRYMFYQLWPVRMKR